MAKEYIESVLGLLGEGISFAEVKKGLEKTLQNRSHTKLLPTIWRGVLRELQASRRFDVATVYVTSKEAKQELEKEINAALKLLGATEAETVKTDETLVGGHLVTFKGKQVDASYKSMLLDVYQKAKN